jgi:hypothetical protein
VDAIRAAIQQYLDDCGDGWQLAHFVIAVGLERITDDTIESAPWWIEPPDQPAYVTDGLLTAIEDQRASVDDG